MNVCKKCGVEYGWPGSLTYDHNHDECERFRVLTKEEKANLWDRWRIVFHDTSESR